MARQPLLFLELNEVNFDYLLGYIERGELPTLRKFLHNHGFARTTSEQRYEELEPWIQWVTAHTGLAFAQHGIFRLGDVVNHDLVQIWEQLEEKGLKVGAISPMNAKMRLKSPAFFVPDPWTPTEIIAPGPVKSLYRAASQAVNDNAQSRLTTRSVLDLLYGAAVCAAPVHYSRYYEYARRSISRGWFKSMFLDLLLSDVFAWCLRRTRPDFASLFLNAGAHIQHHYMYCSPIYKGTRRNPDWYVPAGADPLLDIYRLYDQVLARIQRCLPHARIMIATGLHQEPYPEQKFYWRLKDHATFLRAIGVPFASVEPRMSRDFIVRCQDEAEAARAQVLLANARGDDGQDLFEVDNRGSDLFVMLTYPSDIPEDFGFTVGNAPYQRLRDSVAFVAIKNGEHDGIGYFTDSGTTLDPASDQFPLAQIPQRIEAALGLARDDLQ